MLQSRMLVENGTPTLYVDGKRIAAFAYTTYFEERSRYQDFLDAGCRIFFVNASFTALPINSAGTGFTPFDVGIFEDPQNPDYSEFETAVRKILCACPDAVIFPRINVSMPRWWVESHSEDCHDTPKGGRRECLYSEVFRRDGATLLRQFVRRVLASDYAHRVGGWQLCGGNTQEWFYPDLFGGLSPGAEKPFRDWGKAIYGEEYALPAREDFLSEDTPVCQSLNARRYAEFCNLAVAKTVEHFAKCVKEETEGKQIVGAFYGYTSEISYPLWGTQGLRALIDSPYLDFFSSPNSYFQARAQGIDWGDMMPVDAIRKRGKLCFMECDVRTHLTKSLQDSRPGRYPDGIYPTHNPDGTPTVWLGPPTESLSRLALRKCFAHQLTKASGVWWFDMWGGWYASPQLMEELSHALTVANRALTHPVRSPLGAEVAFLIDEEGYANLNMNARVGRSIVRTRGAMSATGVPFDTLAVEDTDVLTHYRAAVFPGLLPSDAGKRALKACREKGIPCLCASLEHPILTAEELFRFYGEHGLHFYAASPDVVYLGNGFLALHAATAGDKEISLPCPCRVTPMLGMQGESTVTQRISLSMEAFDTVLLEVVPVE